MNQQPIEKQSIDLLGLLEVHSVFHTIQGEGPFSGHPAVFIRLAGCNLQCPACDTDYTSARWQASPRTLLALVQEQMMLGLVVITGGEPFRQNIIPLIEKLLAAGYFVQVETNGTLAPGVQTPFSKDLTRRDCAFIVCSPKTEKINNTIRDLACAFKYVIQEGDVHIDGLPIHALGHSCARIVARPLPGFSGPVYVQPLDEKNEDANQRNRVTAVRSSLKFGYIVNLQIHKLLEVE